MLNLLVAHHAEAVPFIERYRLSKRSGDNHPDYFENASIRLLITGQGEDRSRVSTTRFCQSAPVSRGEGWLNFGLAGSSTFSVGTLTRGYAVTRSGDNNLALAKWPTMPSDQSLPEVLIRSTHDPEQRYLDSGVYDMEAFALYDVLSGHHHQSKFWICKLVSDGPDRPLTNLNKRDLGRLIQKKAQSITVQSDILLRSLNAQIPE